MYFTNFSFRIVSFSEREEVGVPRRGGGLFQFFQHRYVQCELLNSSFDDAHAFCQFYKLKISSSISEVKKISLHRNYLPCEYPLVKSMKEPEGPKLPTFLIFMHRRVD